MTYVAVERIANLEGYFGYMYLTHFLFLKMFQTSWQIVIITGKQILLVPLVFESSFALLDFSKKKVVENILNINNKS